MNPKSALAGGASPSQRDANAHRLHKVPSGWASGTPGRAHTELVGRYMSRQNPSFSAAVYGPVSERNRRSVWTIGTAPFPEAHFATYPLALVEPCIQAGSRPGDLVLDPFAGAGTTLLAAARLGRDSIGIELKESYCAIAERRIRDDAPLLVDIRRAWSASDGEEATDGGC